MTTPPFAFDTTVTRDAFLLDPPLHMLFAPTDTECRAWLAELAILRVRFADRPGALSVIDRETTRTVALLAV